MEVRLVLAERPDASRGCDPKYTSNEKGSHRWTDGRRERQLPVPAHPPVPNDMDSSARRESRGRTGSMPGQRVNYRRITYPFPEDFPERLKRFKDESGLSWSEIARRPGTHRHTLWRWKEGRALPNE